MRSVANAATGATRRPAASARRAFSLVELMLVAAGSIAIVGLVFTAAVDGIYLLRLADQHADRAAVVASLRRALHRDLLAASGATWDDSILTLELPAAPQAAAPVGTIRYVFAPDRVTRTVDGLDSHAWRAARLTFAAQHAPGPRADLLTIEFGEAPPPRASVLPHRAARTAFVLPRAPAAGRGERGEDTP